MPAVKISLLVPLRCGSLECNSVTRIPNMRTANCCGQNGAPQPEQATRRFLSASVFLAALGNVIKASTVNVSARLQREDMDEAMITQQGLDGLFYGAGKAVIRMLNVGGSQAVHTQERV